MEKKTIVWRDGDEQPAKNSDIVICPAGTNLYYIGRYIGKGVIKIAIPAERTDFDDVVEWAYISDVIAASKALDVAIKRLEELSTYQCQDSEQAARLRMRVCAATGLTEINLLMNMKGGK